MASPSRTPQIPKPSPPSAMDWERSFTNVDSETEAELRFKGFDPHKMDQATEQTLSHIYANLPAFPVYHDPRLPYAGAASDDVDRLSYLPHDIRRRIVSRLPVKEAAGTSILSSRWRKIWVSTPLVLIDAHLLPKIQGFRPKPPNTPAITAAVSSILEAHPGPFRCVHLVCSHMNSYLPELEGWLKLLRAKGIKELVLVNRPWPHDVPLPATVFRLATLTRLYLGQWKLPDMAVLREGDVSFPNLRELGICFVFMKEKAVEYLVERCSRLEILNILGSMQGLEIRLVSPTIRCVQICLSKMKSIEVVNAPRLERLVLYGSRATVKIVHAPKLHAFGYLEQGQPLEIRGTIIKAGVQVSRRSIISSVKVLSLNVRFGVRDDVNMVPAFLNCFPNVETLHIKCVKCDKSTGFLNLAFWKKSGPIYNVVSRIKEMSISEFTGEQSAFFFLEFFFQSARVLEIATILLPNPRFTLISADVLSKLETLTVKSARRGCKLATVGILQSNGPDGGQPWNLQTGADMSCPDPFSVVEVRRKL